MSMSDRERGELVKLWRDLPGCKPDSLTIGATGGQYITLQTGVGPSDSLIGEAHAAALARDAIVEWLHSIQCPDEHRCVSFAIEDDSDPSRKYAVEVGRANWWHGPTRLLALIAAARAVGGKG